MISRRFGLDLDGVTLAEACERAEPYRRKHGPADLWLRLDERDGAAVRVRARLRTGTITTYGGSFVPNGTLRGRLVATGVGDGGGVRVTGRMRWGFTVFLVALLLVAAVVVGAMAVAYDNGVIGWMTLVPLAVAAVFACLGVASARHDPVLLRERLELVLTGRVAEHQRAAAARTWAQLLPDRPVPPELRDGGA